MNYKLTKIASLVTIMGLFSVSIYSCKKDDGKKTDDTTKTDDNPIPTNGKDYILWEGTRVEFRNPEMGTQKVEQGDTTFRWGGNKPSGIIGDTILTIYHDEPRSSTTQWTFSGFRPAFLGDEVFAQIRWGEVDGRPIIHITDGDYKLERINGKWVSTLKNGKGAWLKSAGDTTFYSGIEFKATWPE